MGIYIYIYIPPPHKNTSTNCSLHKGTTSMQILPLCYLHLVAASCSYRLVPKMVLTLCNLRWWCFSFHQLAQILHLYSWWSSQLALVVFFLRALAHLLMRILQLALCGGGACIFMWWWLYICGDSGCTRRFCCCYTTEDPS